MPIFCNSTFISFYFFFIFIFFNIVPLEICEIHLYLGNMRPSFEAKTAKYFVSIKKKVENSIILGKNTAIIVYLL